MNPGISEDNAEGRKIISKMNSWPRSGVLRVTIKFGGQSLTRRHYFAIYTQAGKTFIYLFIYTCNPAINFCNALALLQKKQNMIAVIQMEADWFTTFLKLRLDYNN